MSCRIVKLSKILKSYEKVIGKHKYQPIVSVETQLYSSFNRKLCYRGYLVEDLALKKDFLEVFYLLLNSQFPTPNQKTEFIHKINKGFGNLKRIVPPQIHSTNVIDYLLYNFMLLRDEEDFEYIFGQCLGILKEFNGVKIDQLDQNNPIQHFTKHLLNLNQMGEDLGKLLNSMFILYMDHGLTNSCYGSRICVSEGGSVYSALMCAMNTHTHFSTIMKSFQEFIKLTREQIEATAENFHKNKNLLFPFNYLTHHKQDPRTLILNKLVGNDVLRGMEKLFGGKLFFKFDLFFLNLLRNMYNKGNLTSENIDKCDSSEENMASGYVSELNKYMSIIIMCRLTGWLSHIKEQKIIGRTIQHTAAYIGPYPKSL